MIAACALLLTIGFAAIALCRFFAPAQVLIGRDEFIVEQELWPEFVATEGAEANARLIAAAADLLAALHELVQRGPSQFAWERARAAIAKATGGAS